MKTKKQNLSLFVFSTLFLLVLPWSLVHAGIVPCGTGAGGGTPCTICHMLTGFQNLINWAKNIVFTAAMLGIVIGGVLYIVSSGSESMMKTAKGAITASIAGFAITMLAWLLVNTAILYLIKAKPDLGIGASGWNSFNCDSSSSALTGPGGTPNPNGGDSAKLAECNKWCNDNKATGGTPEAEKYNADCLNGCANQFGPGGNPDPDGKGNAMSQTDAQKQLDSCGVKYSNANTLYGVQDVSVKEMCNFKNASGCDTQITSGTSGVHKTGSDCTHQNGCKFDFSPTNCNDAWIKNNYPNTGTRSDGAACYSAPDGACYAREGNHWDMSTTRSCKAQGC